MKRTMRDNKVLIRLYECEEGYAYDVYLKGALLEEGVGYNYREALRKSKNAANLKYPTTPILYSLVNKLS